MIPHAGLWLELDVLRGQVRRAREKARLGDYSESDVAIVQLATLLDDATRDGLMAADTYGQIRHVLGDETY